MASPPRHAATSPHSPLLDRAWLDVIEESTQVRKEPATPYWLQTLSQSPATQSHLPLASLTSGWACKAQPVFQPTAVQYTLAYQRRCPCCSNGKLVCLTRLPACACCWLGSRLALDVARRLNCMLPLRLAQAQTYCLRSRLVSQAQTNETHQMVLMS